MQQMLFNTISQQLLC